MIPPASLEFDSNDPRPTGGDRRDRIPPRANPVPPAILLIEPENPRRPALLSLPAAGRSPGGPPDGLGAWHLAQRPGARGGPAPGRRRPGAPADRAAVFPGPSIRATSAWRATATGPTGPCWPPWPTWKPASAPPSSGSTCSAFPADRSSATVSPCCIPSGSAASFWPPRAGTPSRSWRMPIPMAWADAPTRARRWPRPWDRFLEIPTLVSGRRARQETGREPAPKGHRR